MCQVPCVGVQASGFRCQVSGRNSRLKPETGNLKPVALCLAALVVLGAALDSRAAASVRSHIVWEGDEAMLSVTIDPGAVPANSEERAVAIAVAPVNRRGEDPGGFVTSHSLKLTGDGKPVTGTFPLLAGGTPKDRLWVSTVRVGQDKVSIPGDYVRVSVRDDALGLASDELIYPFRSGSPVHSCGVRLTGGFDDRKAHFFLHIGPQELGMDQQAALEYHLLDSEGNQLSTGEDAIALSTERSAVYEKEVTPGRDATGPYTIAFSLDNEALGMAVASDVRFPFASHLVPVSSMESDTLADWHIPRMPPDSGAARKVPDTLFSIYQPFDRPAFDADIRRGGARSLRIDYAPTAPVTIGSNVRLPGVPAAARIWVKGNNTGDRLVIEWRDPCNFNAPSHQRWMNSMASEICRLDFEDWRCFTVPLMGNGLLARDQQAYMTGHSGIEVRHPVQAPFHCAAVRVIPEPPARGAARDAAVRTVWLDDITVETQAPRNERMTLELRGDTVEARLHADAQLCVSVGNGTGHDILNGRLVVTFLDADGEAVDGADLAEGIDAPAGMFTTRILPLKALAGRNPRGPVTALVTVTGPVVGQRVQGRIVFSRPTGSGLFWDFEKVEHFNPPAPEWYYAATYHRNSIVRQNGKIYISLQDDNRSGPTSAGKWMPAPEGMGADPVAGGADGTARALPLAVATNLPTSVLLHPALPGFPAGVEMQVFGGDRPVFL
ncbi:MAG: hypothetical protein FJ224_11810, partial [Lentisphaerae bacterium]|nr:hypothetical protein [Lentisphaerota bacterium]